MEITGKITGIRYQTQLTEDLNLIDFADFDINTSPTACLVTNKKWTFAISKWVSPKRTRSYPYERVYNTLNLVKKITVIPIVKDEGAKGDRDFIQWDTVSLMSLLDVYVILGYYTDATKIDLKITAQQFDNNFIKMKIQEIENYHSSALHWNLNELNTKLPEYLERQKRAYAEIEQKTGVKLHKLTGLSNFQKKIEREVHGFMTFSRQKAKEAQTREMKTIQPKEVLSTRSKAKITITNYLGGQYNFTVDEVTFEESESFLIEAKHSKNSVLPSKSDIKDGLVKMILYSNLREVEVDGISYKCKPVLALTSNKLIGQLISDDTDDKFQKFIYQNHLSETQADFIIELFKEARDNSFTVKISQI
jgi:hypothetical protein